MSLDAVSAPTLLADSPELAVLDVLLTALATAIPEVDSEDLALEAPDASAQACLAAAVLAHAGDLSDALHRYRTDVARRASRRTPSAAPAS